MLALIEQVAPEGPLALAGFSFGAFVTSHVAQSVASVRPLEKLVLVGTAASRFVVAPVAPELHDKTLVLHGEQDDDRSEDRDVQQVAGRDRRVSSGFISLSG